MEKYAKKCDCCGKAFNAGFLDSGSEWCSMVCLLNGNQENDPTYNEESWEEDCEESEDECYYTEWDEVDEDEWFNKDGVMFTTDYEQELYERLKSVSLVIDASTDLITGGSVGDNEIPYTMLCGELAETETLLKKIEHGG